MKNILRSSNMAIVWTVLRIWLGIQWLNAGVGKVMGDFDASGFLHGTLANAAGESATVQSWYASFVEVFALPNIGIINILIPWGELFVGLGLIFGIATIPALIAGAFMNLNFLFAGTLSTNPMLYTVAMILLFAGSASYYYGLDRLAIPYVLNRFKKKRLPTNKNETANMPA